MQLVVLKRHNQCGSGSALWHSSVIETPTDLAGEEVVSVSGMQSIHSMRTEEWQEQYEADGYVDLWLEEEFNAGSRLVVRFPSAVSHSGLGHIMTSI